MSATFSAVKPKCLNSAPAGADYLFCGERAELSFYRDQGGVEIDLLLAHARELLAIEVKSGQTVASSFFESFEPFERADLVVIRSTWDYWDAPEAFRAWLEQRYTTIDALNHALKELPEDRIRFHMCWGSYHGPHNNGILEDELVWLREAGFEDVDCFWKFTTTVVYGGFKR